MQGGENSVSVKSGERLPLPHVVLNSRSLRSYPENEAFSPSFKIIVLFKVLSVVSSLLSAAKAVDHRDQPAKGSAFILHLSSL